MAYGETFRNANLVPGMALGELYYNVSLAADDTQINTGRNPFLRLTSDNTTAANRTFTLVNGAVDGFILHITLCATGAVATGRAQLAASANTILTGGTWEPAVNDTLTLMWDSAQTIWRELGRSGASTQSISGTYTPTMVAGTNVATATPGLAHYIRIGNEVTVTGVAAIASTAATQTASALTATLPIASNLGATGDLSGTGSLASASGTDATPVWIIGSVAGDVATLAYNANQTASATMTYTFTYTVI